MEQPEKRKFPRLSINVEISYTLPNRPNEELYTTGTRDMSSGGLGIIIFEKLEPGEIVDLRFSLPNLNKQILAQGTVRWIDTLTVKGVKTETAYETGIEFTRIDPGDQKKIRAFVETKQERP